MLLVLAFFLLVVLVVPTLSAGAPQCSNGGTTVGVGREPIGCTSRPGRIVSQGPTRARDVALSFDDGPSSTQTPEILETLNRLEARATFFEEGRHVVGHEALMRGILLDGDEIGNHSSTTRTTRALASSPRPIAASARRPASSPASFAQAHVIGSARPGTIVLMHDGGHHPKRRSRCPG